MLLQEPLALVTPTVDGDVLAVLCGAQRPFTRTELAKMIGDRSYSGVRKAVERLVGQGIVLSRYAGKTQTYELNRDHLAADAIVAIARTKSRLLERLRDHFAQMSPPPRYAAMFGSAARGEMDVDSDIDIFVVRSPKVRDATSWELQFYALEHQAAKWTGNDVRFLEMTEEQVRVGTLGGDPLLDAIRGESIVLAGEQSFWFEVLRNG